MIIFLDQFVSKAEIYKVFLHVILQSNNYHQSSSVIVYKMTDTLTASIGENNDSKNYHWADIIIRYVNKITRNYEYTRSQTGMRNHEEIRKKSLTLNILPRKLSEQDYSAIDVERGVVDFLIGLRNNSVRFANNHATYSYSMMILNIRKHISVTLSKDTFQHTVQMRCKRHFRR